MIEDAKHLQIAADLQSEIERIIRDHNEAANGLTDKGALFELRVAQYETLMELCSEHRRVLRFHLGEKVEPKVHFAEAVICGQGGFGD